MARRKDDADHECPVEITLDVIGGKWKGMVLYQLLEGTARFNEIRRALPKATQRMLTLQLRELESDGVIQRKVYAEVPSKVEYSLTEFGLSLKPILLQMQDWGTQYRVKLKQSRKTALAKDISPALRS